MTTVELGVAELYALLYQAGLRDWLTAYQAAIAQLALALRDAAAVKLGTTAAVKYLGRWSIQYPGGPMVWGEQVRGIAKRVVVALEILNALRKGKAKEEEIRKKARAVMADLLTNGPRRKSDDPDRHVEWVYTRRP